MSLTNNLVLTKKDHEALAEAMQAKQAGDKLTLNGVEVTVVENLGDRMTFDVDEVDSVEGADAETDDEEGEGDTLESSVLGVMSKKGKKK
jgi:hypothetical protein